MVVVVVVLVGEHCCSSHPSPSSSSTGAPRGRSGWSGGRAGSKGAVPPPSGAPEGGWGWECVRWEVEGTWEHV